MVQRIMIVLLTVSSAALLGGCSKPSAPTPGAATEAASATGATVVAEKPAEGGGATVTPTGKKVLMLAAPKDFRDEELLEPKAALEAAGYEVVMGSVQKGPLTGAGGATAEATVTAAEVVPSDYAGVVFVGGPGMVKYLKDKSLVAAAKAFRDAGKVTSAICVAPAILANAGVLKGVEATAFSSELGTLKAGGAKVSSQPVVVCGRIVTANGPAAAKQFGQKVVEALGAQ